MAMSILESRLIYEFCQLRIGVLFTINRKNLYVKSSIDEAICIEGTNEDFGIFRVSPDTKVEPVKLYDVSVMTLTCIKTLEENKDLEPLPRKYLHIY